MVCRIVKCYICSKELALKQFGITVTLVQSVRPDSLEGGDVQTATRIPGKGLYEHPHVAQRGESMGGGSYSSCFCCWHVEPDHQISLISRAVLLLCPPRGGFVHEQALC